MGYEAASQTPQVLPGANLMKPASPQAALQEFLILRAESVLATKRTPWLRLALQFLKIPLE